MNQIAANMALGRAVSWVTSFIRDLLDPLRATRQPVSVEGEEVVEKKAAFGAKKRNTETHKNERLNTHAQTCAAGAFASKIRGCR